MRTFLFPRWDMLGSRKVYALKDPAPKKWDYYWWLVHLSIKKKGGALLLLVVDFFPIFYKLYTFHQKTHSKEMTPQLRPHYLHFGSFGSFNTTRRQCRLWWRKPTKRCHFNHSHRIYGTSIFTIHSPFTMGLVY